MATATTDAAADLAARSAAAPAHWERDELGRPLHPVHGRNWHFGSDIEPPGLLFDAPHWGTRADLSWTLTRAAFDAAGDAAPGEGLTFDGFLAVALGHYLSEVLGSDYSGLHEAAVRHYLAKIGRPLPARRTGKRPRTPRGR